MTAKFDFLCFSSTDWGGWWGSRQQVMSRLAQRGHRILYVEQMAGLEHFWRYSDLRQRRWRRLKDGISQVEDRLWILSPPPLLPGRYYSKIVNKINIWFVVMWSQPTIKKLNFSNPILWLYKPEQVDLIGKFNEQISVYHCIDEWMAGTTGRKRQIISEMDDALVSKVDVVFANSPPTYKNKKQINTNTHRLPSGVDLEIFSVSSPKVRAGGSKMRRRRILEPPIPHIYGEDTSFSYDADKNKLVHPDFARIPKPRIGYSGTINDRLDYATLERVADSHPEWSLVFVGDPYPWKITAPRLQRLSAYPNVYFMGKYPSLEMPAIISSLDVCLLPYIDDERGHYRSPLKLYEYLALGKPVVSLDHPEAREFISNIYVANDPETFTQAISQALTENSPDLEKTRVEIVRKHSWENRVDKIESILAEMIQRK